MFGEECKIWTDEENSLFSGCPLTGLSSVQVSCSGHGCGEVKVGIWQLALGLGGWCFLTYFCKDLRVASTSEHPKAGAGNINGEIVDGSVLACLIERVYWLIFLRPDVEGMQQGVATMNSLSTASEECLQLWTDGEDSQACLADAQLGHPLFK